MRRLPATRPTRPATSALAALWVAPLLGGCLYAGSRTVREHGPQVSAEVVGALTPEETSLEWVLAAYGEPQARTRLPDGREILRYDSEVRTTEGSYFLMLLASSANRIERTCWWFEFVDGRLTRAFGEKCGDVEIGATTPRARVAGAAEAGTTPPADLKPLVE